MEPVRPVSPRPGRSSELEMRGMKEQSKFLSNWFQKHEAFTALRFVFFFTALGSHDFQTGNTFRSAQRKTFMNNKSKSIIQFRIK